MKTKLNQMNSFFEAKRRECTEAKAKLSADGRGDEAVFEKIKGNVYEIFETVLSAAVKAKGENETAVREFFLQKLSQIPQGWQAALTAARTHGDAEREKTEEIKLAAVEDISAAFTKLWEGNA